MKRLFKFFGLTVMLFLVACTSTKSRDGEIQAVITTPDGNLYILGKMVDYEFSGARAKQIRLFFELAPVFADIGQPISARMWVRERNVTFAFNEATLSVYKESYYKRTYRNDSEELRNAFTRNEEGKRLLAQLERMVKKDRSGKLALIREYDEGGVVDYEFRTNKKSKDNDVKGRVVELVGRNKIIKEYQENKKNFVDYRVNVFYEPSVLEKGMFGKKLKKEKLLSGEPVMIRHWLPIAPINVNSK